MSSARRREAEHILKLCLGDHLRAYLLVERQLGALALRAHAALVVPGLVVLATAFSGRAIVGAGSAARLCLALGILLLLAAGAAAALGVLRMRWLSQEIDDEPVVTLLRGLEVRDGRSRSLRLAAWLGATGFALYCLALAQLLRAA